MTDVTLFSSITHNLPGTRRQVLKERAALDDWLGKDCPRHQRRPVVDAQSPQAYAASQSLGLRPAFARVALGDDHPGQIAQRKFGGDPASDRL